MFQSTFARGSAESRALINRSRTMAAAMTCRYTSSATTHYPPTTTPAASRWFVRRPPRPPPIRRTIAQWEKDFCESRGVSWKKVTDPEVGINADPEGSVAQWDDSGAVEALLDARKRYWAEINGGLAGAPPPPDPDMYIDKVAEDDDGCGDVEYEAALRAMEVAWEENAKLQEAMRRDDFVPVATGWDVDT